MRKRSVRIAGHPTSVSLEDGFWDALVEIARTRDAPLSTLIGEIDSGRGDNGLSSAIRLHVLDWYRSGKTARKT